MMVFLCYIHIKISVSVLGALIGQQKGRKIEVMNSFELVFDTIDGDIVVNMDYYQTKEGQCECCVISHNFF